MQIIDSNYSHLLSKAMDAYSLRQQMTSANIANIDTPGYTRHEVNFEQALQKAQEAGRPMDEVNPSIQDNGEEVVLENELMEMADTQMRVQLVTRSLRHHFDMLQTGITSRTR